MGITGFVVLFGILAWIYTQPWLQRLRGWAFGTGVVGACAAMTLLDMAVFPLVIRGIMPEAAVIFERYPVPVTVNRFAFCALWSTLFFVLQQRADVRRTRRQATSALLALRTSELERLSQQIEPHFLFNALSAVLACRVTCACGTKPILKQRAKVVPQARGNVLEIGVGLGITCLTMIRSVSSQSWG